MTITKQKIIKYLKKTYSNDGSYISRNKFRGVFKN